VAVAVEILADFGPCLRAATQHLQLVAGAFCPSLAPGCLHAETHQIGTVSGLHSTATMALSLAIFAIFPIIT